MRDTTSFITKTGGMGDGLRDGFGEGVSQGTGDI